MLRRRGLPASFIAALRRIYEEGRLLWMNEDGSVEVIVSKAGVRQGCPLSPVLFALAVDPVVRVAARVLGQTRRRLRVDEELPPPSTYAYQDDITLVSSDVGKLQEAVDAIAATARRLGLLVNPDKCVWIPPFLWPHPADLTVGGHDIRQAGSAKFLGAFVGEPEQEVQDEVTKKVCRVADDILRMVRQREIPAQTRYTLIRLVLLPKWSFLHRVGNGGVVQQVQEEKKVSTTLLEELGIPGEAEEIATRPVRFGGLGLSCPSQVTECAALAGALDAAESHTPAGDYVAQLLVRWLPRGGPAKVPAYRRREPPSMQRSALRQAVSRLRGVECEFVRRQGRIRFQALVNGTMVRDLPGRRYGGTQAALSDVLSRVEGYQAQAGVPQDLTVAAMSARPCPPFQLSDEEFRSLATAHVCGSPLLPTTDALVGRALCPLCGKVDGGRHLERCKRLQGARTKRHNRVVSALKEVVGQIPGTLPLKEPCSEEYQELGLSRPDIIATRVGSPVVVMDVVVTVATQGAVAALRKEERDKHRTYDHQTWYPPLRRGIPRVILPVALTTRGCLGDEAKGWLRARAREADARARMRNGPSAWFRWSFALAKALGQGLLEQEAEWARLASRPGVFAWAPGGRQRHQ